MIPRSRNLLATGLAATLAVTLARTQAAGESLPGGKPAKVELPQLQLIVDVPPPWRPFLADDLADAFASRTAEVFRRQGYRGEVKFIPMGEPDKDRPLLAVRLISWRIGRTDNAQCTFSASVTTGGREESLGVFDHTILAWNGSMGRWGLAHAMGDAADAGLRDLARKLAQSGAVPGFPAEDK